MKHSNQLLTTAETLRRIFVPLSSSVCSHSTAIRPLCLNPPRLFHKSANPRSPVNYSVPRSWRPSQVNHRLDINNFGPKTQGSAQPGEIRDDSIRAFKVYLVQSDNTLGDPVLLRDALDGRQVDDRGRITQYLRQVRQADDEFMFPVCKYYDKRFERDREIAKKKAAKTAKMESKKLEINWTVDNNDLDHRMARLREFLGKGWRVEIVLGSTRKRGWKGKRTSDLEEAGALIARIRAAALDVEGAKERTEMEGILGQEVVLNFEGTKQKKNNAAASADAAGAASV